MSIFSKNIYAEKILLQPLDDAVDIDLLKFLKEKLEGVFSVEVMISQKTLNIVENCFNPKRRQYCADLILENYLKEEAQNYNKTLLITSVDLYTEGLNFIFGETLIKEGVGIISLCRLRLSFYGLPDNVEITRLRALKEAVHEIGHLYGLRHCSDPRCVMFFSNTLSDTDRKSYHFCPFHKKLLEMLKNR